MKIEARGVIFDSSVQAPHRRVACFPTLCRTSRGTWLSAFQAGACKHAIDSTIGICRSTDGGVTWRQLSPPLSNEVANVPGSLAVAELIEVEPGRLMMIVTWFDRSEPERPLFDPQTEGILHSKQLRAYSHDEGDTWSDWEELPTPGLAGCSLTGPLLEWPDGTIALVFESQQTFDSPRKVPHAAWLMASHDRGRTFADPWLVATHPEGTTCYWDQRLCPASRPGEFVAAFWTHDRRRQQDLPVHLRRGSLGETFDFQSIRDTHLPGQIAAPLWFDDRRLLLFVVDRGRPGTLRLYRSKDGGDTWPCEDHLTVHVHDERASVSQGATNVDYAAYWEDMGKWTFGHPVVRHLDSNRVLLSYYAGTPSALSIHWARVRV